MAKMVTDCDCCGNIALCTITPDGGKYCGCDMLAVLAVLDSLPEPTHEDNAADTRFNIWDDDETLFLDAIQSKLEAA
jgi:hypothetical protein